MTRTRVSKGAATLLAMMLSLTAFAAIPAAAEEDTTGDSIAWGIEYDWSNLGEDAELLSGLNIDEILADVADAAQAAGFDMVIAQVATGSSKVYIEQSTGDDLTVSDLDGDSHQVTEHVTELTVASAVLFDAILLTEWEDPDAGTGEDDEDPTQQGAAIDVMLQSDVEILFTLNSRYIEYRNAANELVGANMDSSGMGVASYGVILDASFTGGDDTLFVDTEFSTSLELKLLDSHVEWRLDEPINVYNDIDSDIPYIDWECESGWDSYNVFDNEEYDYVGDGQWEPTGEINHREIVSDCGAVEGTYASSISYDFLVNGLPVEHLGFNQDVFNIDLEDTYTSTGEIDDGLEFIDSIEFFSDETFTVTIDDAGTQVDALGVEATPVPQPMFPLLGVVMINAFEDSGDDMGIEEVLENEAEAIFEEVEPETIDSCPAQWDTNEMLDLKVGDYNDGWSECADRRDESFEHLFECVYTWEYENEWGEMEYSSWSEYIDHASVNDEDDNCEDWNSGLILDEYADQEYSCHGTYDDGSATGEVIDLDDVNDGIVDCSNSKDENDGPVLNYVCDDGQEVPWYVSAMDGDSCDDGSMDRDSIFCTNSDGAEFSWWSVNDGSVECEDGSDETADLDYCPNGWQVMSTTAFNDGENDCWGGGDEYVQQTFTCYDGGVIELYQANDGINDCNDESDEEGFFIQHYFPCLSGEDIPVEYVGDDTEQCQDGSDEAEEFELSEELINVITHIGDSDIGDIGEAFEDELEITFEDVETEFPYDDGDGTLLWYDGKVVGLLIFVDEDGEEYLLLGPETEGFEQAPTSLSITYLIGSAAQAGQDEAEEIDDVDDLVDPDEHDTSGVDAVEEIGDASDVQDAMNADTDSDGVPDMNDQCPTTPAGSAVADDGCMLPATDTDGDGVADDDDACADTESGATVGTDGCVVVDDGGTDGEIDDIEEQVEEAGIVPSVSLIATIGILALAGLVAIRRD